MMKCNECRADAPGHKLSCGQRAAGGNANEGRVAAMSDEKSGRDSSEDQPKTTCERRGSCCGCSGKCCRCGKYPESPIQPNLSAPAPPVRCPQCGASHDEAHWTTLRCLECGHVWRRPVRATAAPQTACETAGCKTPATAILAGRDFCAACHARHLGAPVPASDLLTPTSYTCRNCDGDPAKRIDALEQALSEALEAPASASAPPLCTCCDDPEAPDCPVHEPERATDPLADEYARAHSILAHRSQDARIYAYDNLVALVKRAREEGRRSASPQPVDVWPGAAHYKAALERIATTKDIPIGVYEQAADALCWARKHRITQGDSARAGSADDASLRCQASDPCEHLLPCPVHEPTYVERARHEVSLPDPAVMAKAYADGYDQHPQSGWNAAVEKCAAFLEAASVTPGTPGQWAAHLRMLKRSDPLTDPAFTTALIADCAEAEQETPPGEPTTFAELAARECECEEASEGWHQLDCPRGVGNASLDLIASIRGSLEEIRATAAKGEGISHWEDCEHAYGCPEECQHEDDEDHGVCSCTIGMLGHVLETAGDALDEIADASGAVPLDVREVVAMIRTERDWYQLRLSEKRPGAPANYSIGARDALDEMADKVEEWLRGTGQFTRSTPTGEKP